MISSQNQQQPVPPPADTPIPLSYTQEDVQQILHLALARQEQGGEMTREQLLEIARDLNISPENLQIAEKEWLNRQDEYQERQNFNIYRRNKLQKNLVKYGIINSFLILLNLVASHELSWSLYILLTWGLALALQGWNTYQSDGEEYEQAFQSWRVKKQLGQSFNTLISKWQKWVGNW